MQASDSRLLIIGHLAQALPAREAGAEVSLAIAGVAADSLSSMIQGCSVVVRRKACSMVSASA